MGIGAVATVLGSGAGVGVGASTTRGGGTSNRPAPVNGSAGSVSSVKSGSGIPAGPDATGRGAAGAVRAGGTSMVSVSPGLGTPWGKVPTTCRGGSIVGNLAGAAAGGRGLTWGGVPLGGVGEVGGVVGTRIVGRGGIGAGGGTRANSGRGAAVGGILVAGGV